MFTIKEREIEIEGKAEEEFESGIEFLKQNVYNGWRSDEKGNWLAKQHFFEF